MKKILVSGFAAAVLLSGVMVLTTITQADLDPNSNLAAASNLRGVPAIILEINQNGKILLRGTINSVGSNSLTVKSWGGVWTVNISSSTEVLPNTDISKFKTGDLVGVQGIVDKDASWSINATIVRDWNAVQTVNIEKKENRKEAEKIMKTSMPRNWQGIASNVNTSNNSLTLTIDAKAFTINVVSGATIVNGDWSTITLGDVKSGDTVRVWGPLSSSTISASVLRDVSLPAKKGGDQ